MTPVALGPRQIVITNLVAVLKAACPAGFTAVPNLLLGQCHEQVQLVRGERQDVTVTVHPHVNELHHVAAGPAQRHDRPTLVRDLTRASQHPHPGGVPVPHGGPQPMQVAAGQPLGHSQPR